MCLFINFNEIPWNDFWNFIRAFIYGSFGGLAAISMSYINNESTSVNLKNNVLMKYFLDGKSKNQQKELQQSLDQIRKPTRRFIFQAAIVHAFIGGVSGMIAVSAFNPTANELQTFSIAVIAGVSGFTFLKRSALIDDELSDKMLDVQKTALEMSLANDNDELIKSTEEDVLLNQIQIASENLIKEFTEDYPEIADVPLMEFHDAITGSEEFENFITVQQLDPSVTNSDINFLRTLFYKDKLSLEQIKKIINDYESDL